MLHLKWFQTLYVGADLRNEGLAVVEFNAWETEPLEIPLTALTTEITEQ